MSATAFLGDQTRLLAATAKISAVSSGAFQALQWHLDNQHVGLISKFTVSITPVNCLDPQKAAELVGSGLTVGFASLLA